MPLSVQRRQEPLRKAIAGARDLPVPERRRNAARR